MRFVPVMFRFVIVMLTWMLTDFEFAGSVTVIVQAGLVATVGPLAALTLRVVEGAGPDIVDKPEALGEPFTPIAAPGAQVQLAV